MVFADKTPYIIELETPHEDYRVMFLRPRRFGKSSFLNMLCEYYDIHTTHMFVDLFGPLYIGRNKTHSANSHLVLKFDLSSILLNTTIERMEQIFNDEINRILRTFVIKYSRELGYPSIDELINPTNATHSLLEVLVGCCSSGYIGFGCPSC